MSQDIRLPESLIYPVEIARLVATEGAEVKKHDPLLQYKYWNLAADGVDENGKDIMVTREFYGTFESPFDGTLSEFLVKKGERLNDSKPPVLRVIEACDHSVQYGGLCAICGIALDNKDYMGYSDTDRAPIAMSHGTQGLTVSRNEAERLEHSSTSRLLSEKKLILIVDLDQTIIHAAVDPQIGQWINDKSAPNHDAVKDVKSFTLREQRREGTVSCSYYIKLRPGLMDFLDKVSKLFELHIYTMATKAYALEIAKIVDPDGHYFGDRILGREESGSLIQKNISRLFPVTTDLVTIIDDRGDVWGWSPHLVRVFPYNFFAGTGDINSGFLPKRSGLVTPGNDDVLSDNDNELEHLGKLLSKIHEEYYHKLGDAPEKLETAKIPDIGKLLPKMKSPVFSGLVFLFSGVFPLGVSIDNADIVQWVRSFGAVVVAELVPAVTHVIANSGGTVKARMAAGAGITVVGTSWIFACLEDWKRVPVDGHVIEVTDPIEPPAEDQVNEEQLDDSDISESFVRSLSRGDLDWDKVNSELNEFMGSDDEDEDAVGESDEEPAEKSTNDLDSGSRASKRPHKEPSDDEEGTENSAKRSVQDSTESQSKRPRSANTEIAESHENEKPANPASDDLDEDFAAELELDLGS